MGAWRWILSARSTARHQRTPTHLSLVMGDICLITTLSTICLQLYTSTAYLIEIFCQLDTILPLPLGQLLIFCHRRRRTGGVHSCWLHCAGTSIRVHTCVCAQSCTGRCYRCGCWRAAVTTTTTRSNATTCGTTADNTWARSGAVSASVHSPTDTPSRLMVEILKPVQLVLQEFNKSGCPFCRNRNAPKR
jgi:hypothetical protein